VIRLRSQIASRVQRVTGTADQGLTLVELLVAMLIFSLLLVMIGGAFSTISKTITLATNTNQNVSFSSLGMNEMSKVLRFATTNPVLGQPIDNPAFVTANNETLTVYTYVDADPTTPVPVEVTFSLDGSRRLVESRYAAYSVATGYYAFKTTPYFSRILTGIVLAPATGEPYLFTYQNASGSPLTPGSTGLSSGPSGQINQVAAVQITLKIKGNTTNGANAVILTNTVGLPNLGIARSGQDI
jgi:prepilin-type N-terminal cleavage/methylation domain-containing protein